MTISPEMFNLMTGMISFLFTLLVFSYVIGDNPLFRAAVYIFVGVSSGYIAAVAVWLVILPRLVYPLMSAITSGDMFNLTVMLPLVLVSLGALMLILPRQTGLGRIVLAFLVGVGAAVTLAGALGGTLIPQVQGTINAFDMDAAAARNIGFGEAVGSGAIILIGTVLTLAYFHFGARQKPDGTMRRFGLIEALAWGGRIFIGIALGAVFAGVYAAALTALIERIASLINFILGLLGNIRLIMASSLVDGNSILGCGYRRGKHARCHVRRGRRRIPLCGFRCCALHRGSADSRT